MLIDTHCHLTDSIFDDDREIVMARAFDAGVCMINCATNFESSLSGIELVKTFSDGRLFTSIGFDPQMISDSVFNELDFRKLLEKNRNFIIAIGECGLEFLKLNNFSEQVNILERQMILAKEFSLPLIIHCRDFADHRSRAFDTLIDLIDSVAPPRCGVVHCFSGTFDHAKKLTERGFYLGFNGIITFDKTGLSASTLENIDHSKILVETDAPFLTPIPFRGQRNEPLFVVNVLRKISEILQMDYDAVCALTRTNAKKLFQI